MLLPVKVALLVRLATRVARIASPVHQASMLTERVSLTAKAVALASIRPPQEQRHVPLARLVLILSVELVPPPASLAESANMQVMRVPEAV